jgi:hypothetical protein
MHEIILTQNKSGLEVVEAFTLVPFANTTWALVTLSMSSPPILLNGPYPPYEVCPPVPTFGQVPCGRAN